MIDLEQQLMKHAGQILFLLLLFISGNSHAQDSAPRYQFGVNGANSTPLLGYRDTYANIFAGKYRSEHSSHNIGFVYEYRYIRSTLYGVNYFYKVTPLHIYSDIDISLSFAAGVMPFYLKRYSHRYRFDVAGVSVFGNLGPSIKLQKHFFLDGIIELQYSKAQIIECYECGNDAFSYSDRVGATWNAFILVGLRYILY